MASPDLSRQLSLIDAGISSIWSLSLPSHVENLNLHGNEIRQISNLAHLSRLTHLDLSANFITEIDGLEKLVALKTLNLSCNQITVVEGLSSLRCLERLNLSYNQIQNISGLAELGSSECCKLKQLALHGNKLSSVKHVVDTLKYVKSLRHLVLTQDGDGNPLCSSQGYESIIFSHLPKLETLSGVNQSGKINVEEDSLSQIPGLDAYLDFLLSSDQQQTSESSSPPVLITPKIDAVMEQFRQRYAQDTSSSFGGQSASSPAPSDTGQHTELMRKILSDTEFSSPAASIAKKQSKGRNTGAYKSSGDESEPVQDIKSHGKGARQKKVLNSQVKQTGATTNKRSSAMAQRNVKDNTSSRPIRTSASPSRRREQQREKEDRSTVSFAGGDGRDDKKGREEAEFVYKDLLSTLETERERRWKAEQATRRLATVLKELQAKGVESESLKQSALEATTQLKQAVLNEHEGKLALTEEIRKQQSLIDELKESLSDARRGEERSREALRAAEDTLASREAEAMAERAHQARRVQETQQRASALARELDVVKHSLEHTKNQLQQVQETLATREIQHREEMKHVYRLDSPELQEVIGSKVKAVEKSQQSELVKQRERVEQLSRQYTELEDEFRYALHTEEKRFNEIKADLEKTRAENLDLNQLLLSAQRKDESSTAMITELSSLVKEQKGRITELTRSKSEQLASYKERIQEQEESLEEARRQFAHMELLKQAKSKLQATVQAQESVIEGLKAERRLWGQELAQQGASLSQDRGRLEAKIESLNAEIASLKKQLERETDTVKIKTKMVEDQTETIRKLKEAVLERDGTIKETREESVSMQRSLEDQLAECRVALEETRDLLDRATTRKEELKQQVSDLQSELKDSKDNHSTLSAKWKEKSELIGRLEQQVTQMRNTWSQKEVQMAAEKKAALEQAKQALENLKSADTAFRHQLDLKEAAYREQIAQIEAEKDREIDLANRKVAMVEEEMRDMLRENEASKKAMEAKLKKFTQALGDLQTDLL